MTCFSININIKAVPPLDPGFAPLSLFCNEFLKLAKKPLSIAIERNNGLISVYDTFITGENREADRYYIERTVKTLLWIKGGFRVFICGDEEIADYIKKEYSDGGAREFDKKMMERIYGNEFEVLYLPIEQKPQEMEQSAPIGGNTGGCRIGFDAGGSDRKVSAVIDGETVYSEETVWHPKANPDPEYHYNEIVTALKTAAAKMPRVDAIGISSAGVYIENKTMVASLFIKVPQEQFDAKVKDIYIRAAKEIGDIPLTVVNDGDVTALAGAMELFSPSAHDTSNHQHSTLRSHPLTLHSPLSTLNSKSPPLTPQLTSLNSPLSTLTPQLPSVLGIAMGTSQAGGFVDGNGHITGWLNELAFAPVDANPDAAEDEWSGDIGCGVKYFSQDGVIKLAAAAGIKLPEEMTPGEKLKAIQETDDPRADDIFRSIGCYLGHTLPYYHEFYRFTHVLLLGRVMSGSGGDIIARIADSVISSEYPQCGIKIHVPDESSRRIGQSVAAAFL